MGIVLNWIVQGVMVAAAAGIGLSLLPAGRARARVQVWWTVVARCGFAARDLVDGERPAAVASRRQITATAGGGPPLRLERDGAGRDRVDRVVLPAKPAAFP